MSESLSMKCRLRGLTMFVFSFGVKSLELNVKLGRLVTFDFLLRTPLFPNLQPKSSAFYSVFVVRAVSQLLYCCCGGERKPADHCFARKFSAYPNVAKSKARTWLAVYEFLCLLTNQNVWFVILLCTELTLFCTEIPENCIYLNQSELSNFFMYIIRNKAWKLPTHLLQIALLIFWKPEFCIFYFLLT